MANAQRISSGFLYPVYVNETATKQRIAPGVYINEKISAGGGGGSAVAAAASRATQIIGGVFR